MSIIHDDFRDNNLLSQALNWEGEGNEGLAMIGNAALKLVALDKCYKDGVPSGLCPIPLPMY